MSQPERFEILVLGSGEGGKYLAWHMAQSGHRSAVVERKWIGGSCPNVNCLSSKNEIWSAEVADLVHHASEFGTRTGPVAIDMVRVRRRKREMVDGLIAMHLDHYKTSGAQLIMGEGRFIAEDDRSAVEWRWYTSAGGRSRFPKPGNTRNDSEHFRPRSRRAAHEHRDSGT